MEKFKLEIDKKQFVDTGILFAIVAIGLGMYNGRNFWFIIAIAILGGAMLFPGLLKPLAWLWFGFSKLLGWASSRIVLFVVFWGLVLPMGMIRKFLKKDIFRLLQFKKKSDSVFIERNHQFSADDLKHMF